MPIFSIDIFLNFYNILFKLNLSLYKPLKSINFSILKWVVEENVVDLESLIIFKYFEL